MLKVMKKFKKYDKKYSIKILAYLQFDGSNKLNQKSRDWAMFTTL